MPKITPAPILIPIVGDAPVSTPWSSWFSDAVKKLNAGAVDSAWTNYVPTVSALAPMTVSGVSIVDAQYLRVGPMVFFKVRFSCTLGGTPGKDVYATPPVAPLTGGTISIPTQILSAGAADWAPAAGFMIPGFVSGAVIFRLPGGSAQPLGASTFTAQGFYPA